MTSHEFTADEYFGQSLKYHRESEGLSMSQLAGMLAEKGLANFYPTTIGRIERGERPVKLSEAIVIAAALQVGIEDMIFTGEPFDDAAELAEWTEIVEKRSKAAAYAMVSLERANQSFLSLKESVDAAFETDMVPPEHRVRFLSAQHEAEALLRRPDLVEGWAATYRAMNDEAFRQAGQEFQIAQKIGELHKEGDGHEC